MVYNGNNDKKRNILSYFTNPPVMQNFVLLNPYKMRNTMFNYLTNNCFIASGGFNRKKKENRQIKCMQFH